ncbi:hypothetical protein [Paenirhodobacter populi]|uniref:hypothetical protein n=1 Tax=Paenirhodobacter populi TaxID=2306993 RepID=UPI000FE3A701|nr:hypothetical protein [Sinirhodobacter populi]
MEKPNIETGVGSMVRMVADQVLAGAGLALLRGPAGIGKTFALNKIEAEIEGFGRYRGARDDLAREWRLDQRFHPRGAVAVSDGDELDLRQRGCAL